MSTPFTVALVLLVLLVGAGFAFDGGDAKPAPKPPAEHSVPIATLEHRVEAIRHLRFESLPKPAEVSPKQAERDGLEDLDRSYPPARRHADEEVLKLLGLLQPDVDLRKVSATVFGQGVAGYYDPRTKRLRIVTGAQTSNRVLNEITLAHELTHALEDQHFKLDLESSSSDDAGLANLALVEGSATAVMFTYAQRHFTAEQTLGGLFSSLGQDTGDLPPFVEAQLVFPYIQGQAFIQRLYDTGGGTWSLVNSAYRFRPPASTEQILHPDKYLQVEQPDHVAFHVKPGAGWARVVSGTWGEWATGQLIGNSDAAAGWGGDHYELWRRGSADCTAPCRDRDALVMRWRWDDLVSARRFKDALEGWRAGRPGASAVSSRGLEVALALAPDAELAQRLVQ
jgi:hypothetical protein